MDYASLKKEASLRSFPTVSQQMQYEIPSYLKEISHSQTRRLRINLNFSTRISFQQTNFSNRIFSHLRMDIRLKLSITLRKTICKVHKINNSIILAHQTLIWTHSNSILIFQPQETQVDR
jgi:hypothetical protein